MLPGGRVRQPWAPHHPLGVAARPLMGRYAAQAHTCRTCNAASRPLSQLSFDGRLAYDMAAILVPPASLDTMTAFNFEWKILGRLFDILFFFLFFIYLNV